MVVKVAVDEFFGCDDDRVGKPLVEFGDLDLLLVLADLFDGIAAYGKLLQLLMQFVLQVDRRLVITARVS